MSRGDIGPLKSRLERQIHRAEEHAAQELGPERASLGREVGVIAGVSLTMLGIRAVKILPSIPFAPGHKLVLLTPLYVMASLLTKGRWGATFTGLSMGIVSFLLGDGRYGVFEILKHVVPGVLCDLWVPLLVASGRRPGKLAWALVCGVIAAGRYAAIVAVTLLAQPPAVALAFLVPGLSVHVGFGLAAGLVVPALIRAFDSLIVDPSHSPPPLEEGKGTP